MDHPILMTMLSVTLTNANGLRCWWFSYR